MEVSMSWTPKRKVVVPLDFSDDAFAAIDVAMEIVARPGDVELVHVLPEIVMVDPVDSGWRASDDSIRIEEAKKMIRERLADPKYQELPLTIVVGNPGHCIVNFANEQGADLIVIPSHGRTGIARMLMGSVAERVVRLAHCPVLVLRK
jgi:nucleotide-binding universal stress UspA family protein